MWLPAFDCTKKSLKAMKSGSIARRSESGSQRGNQSFRMTQQIQRVENAGADHISLRQRQRCPFGLDERNAEHRLFKHIAIVAPIADGHNRIGAERGDVARFGGGLFRFRYGEKAMGKFC